ncbi:ankyrin repeat domain-containing protein 6 [Pholidichthys leucotaenia]
MLEYFGTEVCEASHLKGLGHQTELHRSAMVGNSEAIAALIQGGCAVDLQDRDGNTALHEASWHGFLQCVKLLVKGGADVNVRNKAGNTALHLACQNAHAQTARLLLLGGSTPDIKNNMGDTCLHVAARYNNLAVVKILLSSLCSVTERNQGGDTALHVAAALNHKKMVQLLLEAGTGGNIRNKAGKTALDKARDNNHKDVALLLARAPQVQRFHRGRTIRRRRERLKAERRTQSVTRVEFLPNKEDSTSVVEESPSSGQKESSPDVKIRRRHQQQQLHHQIPATIGHGKRRRGKEQTLNEDEPTEANNLHQKNGNTGKTYQLYTLYRDKEGKIRQAPAGGCQCKPLLKKLEGQVKATQGEMRLHILNVQEQVSSRLGKMDRRNKHQIKVLDILNQQRVAAERMNMICRIEQRAAQSREEAMMAQAAVRHELKRWCISQLKDMNVHIPAEAQCYKLLPSPSVAQSVAEADLESLPLLSVFSGDSSTSLATYINILPSRSTFSPRGPDQEQTGSRTYFEMKMDSGIDHCEMPPLPAKHHSGILLSSAEVQEHPVATVVPMSEEGFSSSSSTQSSINHHGPKLIPLQGYSYDGQHRKHFGEATGARGRNSGTTLEFFIDRPAEPTFSQERNNLHAIEVTQCFFETVSTQLERWCERKILEVEQQSELRAQQDRKELLQRISMLEEELQRLKASEDGES